MNSFKKWFLLSIPGFLGFLAIYILPFFESTVYSFLSNMFEKKIVWFDNYRSVLSNEYFRLAARNTSVFLVTACFSVMLISLLLAYGIFLYFRESAMIKSLLMIAFLVPDIAGMPFWQKIFDPVFFAYNVPDRSFSVFLSQIPLLLIFLCKNCGLAVLIINTSFKNTSGAAIEAARLDGAGNISLFTHIMFPAIKPNLLFVLVLTITEGLRSYRISYLYFNSDYPPSGAYFMQNYINNHFNKLDYELLSAASVLFMLFTCIITGIFYHLERRTMKDI